MIIRCLASVAVAAIFLSTAALAQSAPAGGTAGDQIRVYYDGVKDLYREAAKLLGGATREQRPPLITLQRHCSRSLAGIRQKLNEAEFKPEAMGLVAKAQIDYEKCKQKFEELGQG